MNTASTHSANAPRRPDLHLIVPPPGHLAAIEQALAAADAQQPLLAWRRRANTVRLLDETDAVLDALLRESLLAGHAVTVWHGLQDWEPSDLQVRLGSRLAARSANVQWSRLRAPEGEPRADAWQGLTEALGQPDEADVRLWLGSDGTQWPCWQLSEDPGEDEALNQQGLAALGQWVWVHLAPTLAEWDAASDDEPADIRPGEAPENAEARPKAEADAKGDAEAEEDRAVQQALDRFTLQWPGQDDPVWEGTWLAQGSASQVGGAEAPANDRSMRLQAKGLSGAPLRPETRSARLSRAPIDAAGRGSAEEPVQVRLTRPAGEPTAAYEVQITLPAQFPAQSAPLRACLWLHPEGLLPLSLPFQTPGPGAVLNLPWPEESDNPRYWPGENLWQAIGKGTLSLKLL